MEKIFSQILKPITEVLLGKEHQIRLALACFFAGGHLLIEDLPGVGKTTLAHTLASVLGLQFQRIQFTSDLLPADILGTSIFDRDTQNFRFHKGPLFSQLILADEVNRATPKTQSALLEAMAERQVTVDGATLELPSPFFVVATQNPSYQIGTFPLPESQLDRFLMRIDLGYPSADAERELLSGQDRRILIAKLQATVSLENLLQLQAQAQKITVTNALLDYVQAILHYSRAGGEFVAGLSPRAGLALIRSAKAWALMASRDYVTPEDIQAVLPCVVNHRLQTHDHDRSSGYVPGQRILAAVPV